MNDPQPKKSRRWRVALAIVCLTIALIPGLWFGARFWILSAIDDWRESERQAGRNWACANPQTSGFPFRLDYSCPQPTLLFVSRTGRADVSASALHVSASLADPMRVRASLTGPVQYAAPRGANATFDWKALDVDLRFGLNGIRDADLKVEGLEATTQDVQLNAHRVGADSIYFDARGLDQEAADIELNLKGVDAPDAEQLTGSRDLIGVELVARLGKANLIDPGDLPFSLEEWRIAAGELEVSKFAASQGSMSVLVDGQLGLDERHRARGALSVAAAGLDPVLRRYGVSPAALSIGGTLGGLFGGKPPAGSASAAPALRLPVTLRDGQVFVGPVRAPFVLLPLY